MTSWIQGRLSCGCPQAASACTLPVRLPPHTNHPPCPFPRPLASLQGAVSARGARCSLRPAAHALPLPRLAAAAGEGKGAHGRCGFIRPLCATRLQQASLLQRWFATTVAGDLVSAFAAFLLQGAASWQAAEAALYLLSAVSLAVKTRVMTDAPPPGDENSGGGGGGDAAAAAVVEDRQQTQQLLGALFGQLCSAEAGGSMLGAHPVLAEAACRLLERYSSWLGRAAGGVPLQGAFQLLLRALLTPQVGWVGD